jgi:hypothetical protein
MCESLRDRGRSRYGILRRVGIWRCWISGRGVLGRLERNRHRDLFGAMRSVRSMCGNPIDNFRSDRGVQARDLCAAMKQNKSGDTIDAVKVDRDRDFVYIAVREGEAGSGGCILDVDRIDALARFTPVGAVPDEDGVCGAGICGGFQLFATLDFNHLLGGKRVNCKFDRATGN